MLFINTKTNSRRTINRDKNSKTQHYVIFLDLCRSYKLYILGHVIAFRVESAKDGDFRAFNQGCPSRDALGSEQSGTGKAQGHFQ